MKKENTMTLQENHVILRERARSLARESRQAAIAGESLDIIAFRLAVETYGVASAFVREVYPLNDFTPLPGVPSFVLGIVNVRGQILSVIDLREFFNLSARGLGQLNKMILLGNKQMEFGILADDILGTKTIALEGMQSLPATVSGIGEHYVSGVSSDQIIVLDAERILSDGKIVVDQAVE